METRYFSSFSSVDFENFDLHSPSLLVKKHTLDFPPIYILHGQMDATVPFSSSKIFYEELKACNVKDVSLLGYKDMAHVDFTMDLMVPNNPNHSRLVNDLVSIINNKKI